ncbi:phage major capsid protein, P2 family [Marinobacter sp. X15-166B]|uniref:phage major capsid protein, P2 family n=1 Tax=Marinobacter sp. X15-166B TaxID=1897620 RepID=UPI00085BFD13|nr:phage major capsid protein, P2 family [Marinobacter sp. X15-166B]OEY67472.1 phage major capsid protein, P2 family [Marinobacter sp. X15-166B]
MRTESRVLFNQLRQQIAQLNGVDNPAEAFAVTPSVQQTLENRIQESSAFLQSINLVGVDEIKGEKIGLGVGSIAGRTDVSSKDRTPRDVSDLGSNGYECFLTEFDTALPYSKIDAWAKFPNFQALVRDAIIRQQALDRIMIGFNGTSAAAETNRTTNPFLQDVNIGWLEHYRTTAPERVMAEVVGASGEVTVGAAGDYKNLDALVYNAVNNLIDPWHRESPDLVVLIGRTLLEDKYFPLINENQTPSEKAAADLIVSQKRMGGLQAVSVPFIPAGTIMITPRDNLSIYYQTGSRRRQVIDNPRRNRIENFESSNEAYVVEDFGAGCVIENIKPV